MTGLILRKNVLKRHIFQLHHQLTESEVRRILDHNVPVYILMIDEGHFDCIEDARVAHLPGSSISS